LPRERGGLGVVSPAPEPRPAPGDLLSHLLRRRTRRASCRCA